MLGVYIGIADIGSNQCAHTLMGDIITACGGSKLTITDHPQLIETSGT